MIKPYIWYEKEEKNNQGYKNRKKPSNESLVLI